MKRLALILLAVAAFAATTITITLPDGTPNVATLGPGLVVLPKTSTAPASVQVQFPTSAAPIQVWGVPLRKAGAAYVLSPAPTGTVDPATLRVYRNGLRLFLGADYSVDAALTITPLTPWADDDTLQADYSR